MRKSLLTLSAIATAVTGFASVPAAAQYYGDHDRYERRDDYRDGYRYDRRDDRRYDRRDNRRYDSRYDPRYDPRGDYRYDQRQYRRCTDGTGGTIIGGVAGALAGREIAGRRGDRTAGAIIGGAIGALAGRAIDRSDNRCR